MKCNNFLKDNTWCWQKLKEIGIANEYTLVKSFQKQRGNSYQNPLKCVYALSQQLYIYKFKLRKRT